MSGVGQPDGGAVKELTVGRLLCETPGTATRLARLPNVREPMVHRQIELAQRHGWSRGWLLEQMSVLSEMRSFNIATVTVSLLPDERLGVLRPFVPGSSLLAWAQALDPGMGWGERLDVFRQLFAALADLHRQGVVHGGICSPNVIVPAGGQRLMLTDAVISRAVLTMAPQVESERTAASGPSGRALGFMDDLARARELLRACMQIWIGSPAAATETSSSLLRRLGELIPMSATIEDALRMLLDSRLGSAEAGRVAELLADAARTLGTRPSEGRVDPMAIALRRETLELVREVVDHPAGSRPHAVCMVGENGTGKTSILETIARDAKSKDLPVLQIRARERFSARPLGAFRDGVRSFIKELEQRPGGTDKLRRIREGNAAYDLMITASANGIRPGTGDDTPPRENVYDSSLQLAGAFVREFGPIMLTVDDCHLLDPASATLLSRLLSQADSGEGLSRGWVVVMTTQPHWLTPRHGWAHLVPHVPLTLMDCAGLQQLLMERFGPLPAATLTYLHDWADGRPELASSLAQALHDTGRLHQDGAQLMTSGFNLGSLSSIRGGPVEEAALRLSALDGLPADCVRLLGAMSLLSSGSSPGLLSNALGLAESHCRDLLEQACAHGVIDCSDTPVPEYTFRNENMCTAARVLLDTATAADLHHRIALALSTDPKRGDDYDIAFHLKSSGRIVEALPHALSAGERALQFGFLDAAHTVLAIALESLQADPARPPEAALPVYEAVGRAHMLTGNYETAHDAFLVAFEKAGPGDARERARIAVQLSELAFKAGQFDDARRWRSVAFEALGIRFPKSRTGALVQIVLDVAWPSTIRHAVGPKSRPSTSDSAGIECRLYARMIYDFWFSRSRSWVAYAASKAIRSARRTGSEILISRARAELAVVLAGFFPLSGNRVLSWAERYRATARTLGEPLTCGEAEHYAGFVLNCSGRFSDAIEAFGQAVTDFESSGDYWERFAATWQMALCHYRLGRTEQAADLAQDTYHAARRVGDTTASGTSLAIWARCSPADVTVTMLQRAFDSAAPNDPHTRALVAGAQGWRLMYEGDHAGAAVAFRDARRIVRGAGLRNHFIAQIDTWHLIALRHWHDSLSDWSPRGKGKVRRALRRQLRRSIVTACQFPAERPGVLREWGVFAAIAGHPHRARWLVARARRTAMAQGCEADVALCDELLTALGSSDPTSSIVRPTTSPAGHVAGDVAARPLALSHVLHGSRGKASEQGFEALGTLLEATDWADVLARLSTAVYGLVPVQTVSFEDGPVGTSAAKSPPSPGQPSQAPREVLRIPVRAAATAVATMVVELPAAEVAAHARTLFLLADFAGRVAEGVRGSRESRAVLVAVHEAERGRIARDLHDELGSIFTAIHNEAMGLANQHDETVRNAVRELTRFAVAGISATRRTAWGTRPAGLEHFGLLGCIEELTRELTRRTGIDVDFVHEGLIDPRLLPEQEIGVFRIVQEALVNIERHSQATEATVMFVATVDRLRVVVEDNGRGFDAASDTASLGVTGMRERAALIAGAFGIESSRGKGTTVFVDLGRQL